MFSDQEFEQYLDQTVRNEAGRMYIRTVRRNEPSRSVRSGPHNITCRFASRKMGRVIQAESRSCEELALWIWEMDLATHEFWDQPPQVKLRITRKDGVLASQLVTPDFFLMQTAFAGWVECKPEKWLETRQGVCPDYYRDEAGRWRYRPGEEFAEPLGLQYIVRTDKESNRVLVDNNKMLRDYLVSDRPEVSEQARSAIMALFADSQWLILADLLWSAADGYTAEDVFGLIATQELCVDLLNERLGDPEHCQVYRDRDAMAMCMAIAKAPRKYDSRITIIDLCAGGEFDWDGQHWTIINRGETEFLLQVGDASPVSVPIATIEKLVSEGKISASQNSADPRRALAKARLLEATPEQRQIAAKRFQILFPEAAEHRPDTPSRTLRCWRRAYERGELRYGSGYIGLLPDTHRRGNRQPRFGIAHAEIIQRLVDERYACQSGLSVKAVHALVDGECEKLGLVTPSQRAVRREIRRQKQEEMIRKREGNKRADPISPGCDEDPDFFSHGQRSFEIGHIDHTTMDLQLRDSRFGEIQTRKAYVTILLDSYSRLVLSFFITFDEPSYRSCMMVLRECVRRFGRIPDALVVDGGAEFDSIYFNEQCAFLECNKVHRRKSQARDGTLVERFFKTMNDDFIHDRRGNNVPLQRPRSMSRSHDPRKSAVWTIERFIKRFEEYVDEIYANKEHEGLGVSPKKAFEHGLTFFGDRKHRRIAYDDAFQIMSMPVVPSRVVKIMPGGKVKINGIVCSAPELGTFDLIGTVREARYNPFQMGRAYVFAKKWIEVRAANWRSLTQLSEVELLAKYKEFLGE